MSKQKKTIEDCHFYAVVFMVLGIALIVMSIPLFTLSFFVGVFIFLLGVFCMICSSSLRKQEKDLKEEKARKESAAKKRAAEDAAKAEREAYYRQAVERASAQFAAVPRAKIEQLPAETDDGSEALECKHTSLTSRSNLDEFVVIDTETTGLHKGRDKIVEIASVRFKNGKATEIFETLVNPGKAIPADVSAINHITDDMVADCPTIEQIMPAFDRFVGTSTVVGHNLDFDLGFILAAGSRINHIKRKYYCTYEQAKRMLKKPQRKWDAELQTYMEDFDSDWDVENHKLGTLCTYYGIVVPDQHRAAADAYVTGQLLLHLAETRKSK